ncbi:RNA polymerase sigma factor [Kriegella aquimaris]|uniref:RNA polymerase sigma-70 factor, ECF subfamily n=1 Tax=Kriegella aquimaris TaxID=192904 RepID=A0A1G9NSG8_9FLAO|nr:sigma-70 family RNA polymerase sigma factor [Kriegella aquimaris]SDL89329.1 RNA polymerase sigma-70 factor, ECF subfamily [Kriegella aquimaris]
MKTSDSRSELSQKAEAAIWKKVKKGDTDALGVLYDQFVDTLFSYGMQQSNHKDHVMDCIHDLFVDLYKYRNNLAQTDNVKFYLLRSLKRKINKKYQRKIIPIQEEAYLDGVEEHRNFVPSHEDDLIHAERANEKSEKLVDALSTLSKKQKKGLFLRFNQDRPYEEIAEIMNVSVATARTIIYRAIKSLRKYPLSLLFLFSILFSL